MRWYRKAAAQGDSRSQNNVGALYRNGRGVPQNYTGAMRWFRMAADRGESVAQYNIGVLYINGLGVPAGDVWFPQPAPQDHPWRTMPHHGMTPHISGTSLWAQARYAAGTREILEFERRPIRDEYLIVDSGKLAGTGAHSYSAGDATRGAQAAASFKKSA
jgi:TPR repeat protein